VGAETDGAGMNGKIDRDGVLWIERRGEMRKVECRLSACGGPYCNDLCSQFGEPRAASWDTQTGQVYGWTLRLCHTWQEFNHLEMEKKL
jgi:hypothetical protein